MSEKKIKGSIICHCRDSCGEIIVADDGATRSLYFGDGILQSSIRLDQPGALVEGYNQAMMSALIFKHAPQSVLLIGLGGCSLVNFLLRAFPGCVIDVVEIRRKVIDLAYDFFLMPEQNANLKIFHAAGQDFIMRQEEGGKYDIILVDAFDENGPAVSLVEMDFLRATRERLNESGIFAINLWSRPRDNFPFLYARLREAFGNNALKLLLSEAYWNTIVFGFADSETFRDLPACRQVARTLQQKYNINFPKYLKYLYWQNFS